MKKKGKPKKKSVRRLISNLQHYDITSRATDRRFKKAVRDAKRRDIHWGLTMSNYAVLVCLPCIYCGVQRHEQGMGLDRMDITKGYTKENVSPCCFICNMMRGIFPRQFFLDHIRKIRLKR